MSYDLDSALDVHTAKKLILSIVFGSDDGVVTFTDHAYAEMDDEDPVMSEQDIENILRGGKVQEPEWRGGEWRYRVFTTRMAVVVAFAAENELIIVTAWRFK